MIQPTLRMAPVWAAMSLAALTGCEAPESSPASTDTVNRLNATNEDTAETPPTECWQSTSTPAVIETQTEHRLVTPAATLPDGTLVETAVYETETQQTILNERQVQEFQVPCPDIMTPDFIASLQRALRARGFYDGPITGQMDNSTRASVARFQAEDGGAPRGTLTLTAARQLGLIAIELPESP